MSRRHALYKFIDCQPSRALLDTMVPLVFAPSERLRPFVRVFWVTETAAGVNAVLPEPALMLGFRFHGSAALLDGGIARPLPRVGLVGMRTTLRHMQTSVGGTVVAVFRTLGAAQLFAAPMNELFGDVVGLADMVDRRALADVEERLAFAQHHAERVALVDAYLCSLLGARPHDPLVAAAVTTIEQAHGAVRIATLAKRLGTSQDPLEKRFRRLVGASPKQLASIVRFRRVVARYATTGTLSALAHDAGYFDQSHLIRDFRAFTGEAPERFLRAGRYC